MPYRTETLCRTVPSKYGIWENRKYRSLLVRLRFSPERWGFRWEGHDQNFENVHEACKRLEWERVFTGEHGAGFIVDRKTGKCFSPHPKLLDDLVEQRCLRCKAEKGERCDAGLHS